MTEYRAHIRNVRMLAYEALEWCVSGVIVGVCVGGIMAAFRYALEWCMQLSDSVLELWYGALLLPAIGLGIAGIIIAREPLAGGLGTNSVIKAILEDTKLKLRTVPMKFVATVLTLCSGGSGGREGPALQMSIHIGDWLSRLIPFRTIPRQFVAISAVSASFAAMFNAPLAGAVFGCEVLSLRGIRYKAFLTSLLASVFAFIVVEKLAPERVLSMQYVAHDYSFFVHHTAFFAGAGLLVGGVGMAYIWFFRTVQRAFTRIPAALPVRTAIGGVISGGIGWLLLHYTGGAYSVYGVSTGTFHSLMSQADTISIALVALIAVAKFMATCATVGSSASAGMVMPTMFFGACVGMILGKLTGFPPGPAGVIGMLAFFGGVAHVPLAMTLLAVEAFGNVFALPVGIAAFAGSWLLSYHSIYPAVENAGYNRNKLVHTGDSDVSDVD